MTASVVCYSYLESPIGRLLLAGDGTALHLIGFPSGPHAAKPDRRWMRSDKPFATVRTQLREYFTGRRRRFDLPLATGGTDFQQAVWQLLQTIPYGETRSYGWLARELGRPQAARAVGAANGANPIPIVVPCHRVIGSDGSLTGFGGGIDTKRFLLALERGAASAGARSSPRARRA